MDDMDQFAIKAGGDPSFFVGNLEQYAWTRLMDSRLGNQERMNLYSEALMKFSEAKQLPELFRGIFKSAFLPYRSPEVLGLFLKEIGYFDYSHSEELGNAYEYLLSIMGSQGDAGQFRTPRHIIDFIVAAVNPTKDDKVLDPACGTAGFLVSAYKHILEQHDGKNPDGLKNEEKPLTPDQRRALMNNFEGYDVDPGMVRISQVNLYLHNFRNPKIYNYNTLSQDERWADKFDVILANPPFMSPKGGVSTHNKFSVQSSRSEVLFVGYITNHLRPKGRAGIIVPEGIIFQSGTAHKQLRRNLIEDGLYTVVSLPSGVFQPYSGVKTSILLFNNELAKQSAEILFVKIENDGFDLGATKRPINKNDLPQALEIINAWKSGRRLAHKLALYVEKTKIDESGDYSLSGDRYRVIFDHANTKWPMVKLIELCEIITGKKDVNEGNPNGEYPFFTCAKENTFIDSYSFNTEALLITGNGDVGAVKYYKGKFDAYQRTYVLNNFQKVNAKYLYHILNNSLKENLQLQKLGNTMPYIKLGMLQAFQIPLPPLEVQESIVAELDGYQNIITGARQVVGNWKLKIDSSPSWEKIKLGNLTKNKIQSGCGITKDYIVDNGDVKFVNIYDLYQGYEINTSSLPYIRSHDYQDKYLESGDILFVRVSLKEEGAAYSSIFNSKDARVVYGDNILRLRLNNKAIPSFLNYLLRTDLYRQAILKVCNRANVTSISATNLSNFEILLPSLEIQKHVVEKIEAERALVESAKKLIGIYEQKTKDVLAKLWAK